MHVSNLGSVGIDDVLDCFRQCFPAAHQHKDFYLKRWVGCRVSMEASLGMFDEGKIVGFVIIGIGSYRGTYSSFNEGTGVLPAFRGFNVTKRLYAASFEHLRRMGIAKSVIGVLTAEQHLMKLYKGTGYFETGVSYSSFKGVLKVPQDRFVECLPTTYENIRWEVTDLDSYSWDNCREAALAARQYYKFYEVLWEGKPIGFFSILPRYNYLIQFEVYEDSDMSWNILFRGIASISRYVNAYYVNDAKKSKIAILKSLALNNYWNFTEMELSFKP